MVAVVDVPIGAGVAVRVGWPFSFELGIVFDDVEAARPGPSGNGPSQTSHFLLCRGLRKVHLGQGISELVFCIPTGVADLDIVIGVVDGLIACPGPIAGVIGREAVTRPLTTPHKAHFGACPALYAWRLEDRLIG